MWNAIDTLAYADGFCGGGCDTGSHATWLTPQVAEEIWVVADNTVSKWNGTIAEYKEHLKSTHAALADRNKNTEMTER